uniref:Viral coat protein P2 N-terminal domain-containing protein n=1 Tax=Ditylum brightwellii TaxID=49249 RepID=A0A7S4T4U9_9STRA|mmetsp:Transcript_37406/g.57020  ORF Transcript_37406/g.57020 Transcript_37406/m.57020 type:complete len:167 (+) Transcript_37406:227-727(+)
MGMRQNFSQSLDLIGTMANGGTLKALLDGGATLDEITIVTDLAAAEFTLVVEVEGDRRVEITGQQMLDREAYEGRAATSGQFVFTFADPIAKTLQGESLTGMVTQPGQRVLVALELAASGIAGTETAVLYTETSENRVEEFRLYCLPELVPVSQTGENQFEKEKKR